MRRLNYECECRAGTVVTLRMSAPYIQYSKAHAVITNSAFSSVKTVIAAWYLFYRQSIDKTAHKWYMEAHEFQKRGTQCHCAGHITYGVGWLDGKRKDLMATCDTTLSGNPAQHIHQEVLVSPTAGSAIVNAYGLLLAARLWLLSFTTSNL